MVSAALLLFVLAAVVGVLGLMLQLGGTATVDGQGQADSSAAFYLAESGLERGMASVQAGLGGGYTQASCTGAGGTFTIGRGSVTLSGVSQPATCSLTGSPRCTRCTLTATGRVLGAQHTLSQDIDLGSQNGTFCNGDLGDCSNSPTVTWKLDLRNNNASPSIGVFNLTYSGHGNNVPTCAPGSNCRLEQDLGSSSNGTNSTGLMGNAVPIPANASYPIYQTMSRGSRSLVEVGALFLGSNPTLTGPDSLTGSAAFWDDARNSATNTVGTNGANTGATNDGSANSGTACQRPSARRQTCDSWCYGGDTLVYSFSANVTALSDGLTGVRFGSGAQSLAMTLLTKYPDAGSRGAPPVNLDAEVWYARNANFSGSSPAGSPLVAGASSYKGRGQAALGAAWTSGNTDTTAITGTNFTVGNSFGTSANQLISPGDAVSVSGGGGTPCGATGQCGTIVSQLSSTEPGGRLGGRGTYRMSATNVVAAANNRAWVVKSNVLRVSNCQVCAFAAGDALGGGLAGRSISAQATPDSNYGLTEVAGGVGRYTVSGAAAQLSAAANNAYAGTPGALLFLPSSAGTAPAASALPMLVKQTAGTGSLVAGTRVTASSAVNAATTQLTLSATPATVVDGATLCGGTCALFVTGGNTPFTLSGITANFNEWASGFMCLKGVDQVPQVVTRSYSATGRWTEAVAP